MHKPTQGRAHQDANLLHMPSAVFNSLGIDGRDAFVLFSGLIKENECAGARTCVCVCVSICVCEVQRVWAQ